MFDEVQRQKSGGLLRLFLGLMGDTVDRPVGPQEKALADGDG